MENIIVEIHQRNHTKTVQGSNRMNIKSISKKEFYLLNIIIEAKSNVFATEIEWFKDNGNRVLGVILKDKIDKDFSYVILASEVDNTFRAVDVKVSISSIDSARDELISKLNESINKGKYEQTLFQQEKLIIETAPTITITDVKDSIISDTKSYSIVITDINEEIKKYLNRNPQKLYDLSPRKFEELIGSIMEDLGFSIELTKATRDGGRDIIAKIENSVTDFLAYIECKRYSPENKIGVGIIREVTGVHYINKPSKSIIVTTSFFTRDAVELARKMENQMDLKDFNSIKEWLKKY